jgi:hypothetical protein
MTMLYHYCSLASLLKIIESASIHCSNVSLANDPNEIILAKRDVFPDFFQKLAGIPYHGIDNTHEFFVLSLSRKPDALSQWRGYGDMGKGVMLELDLDVLKACNYASSQCDSNVHILNDSVFGTPVFEAVDVIYNEQVFKARLEEAFKHHDDGKLLKSIKEMDVTDINFIKFVNRLNGLSACYKSAFYKEEDEVRCVIFSDTSEAGYRPNKLRGERWGEVIEQQVLFLESQGKLSPRFPLRLKFKNLMALHGVMLGPANPNSVDMLQAVLQKNGFADTKIDKSVGYFRAPN